MSRTFIKKINKLHIHALSHFTILPYKDYLYLYRIDLKRIYEAHINTLAFIFFYVCNFFLFYHRRNEISFFKQ
nr:MAG TPA: hypothetical protein [Caudoviricetes sp.]